MPYRIHLATAHMQRQIRRIADAVLPKPALAKQGVAFGVRRDVSAADLQTLNIYLAQRRETGEIDALVDKASQLANADKTPQ